MDKVTQAWFLNDLDKWFEELVGKTQELSLSVAGKELSARKPIVPEVCDRLKCNIPSCYGWDLCREARDECSMKEWDKFIEKFLSEEWLNE